MAWLKYFDRHAVFVDSLEFGTDIKLLVRTESIVKGDYSDVISSNYELFCGFVINYYRPHSF